jgi:hypothetical protein
MGTRCSKPNRREPGAAGTSTRWGRPAGAGGEGVEGGRRGAEGGWRGVEGAERGTGKQVTVAAVGRFARRRKRRNERIRMRREAARAACVIEAAVRPTPCGPLGAARRWGARRPARRARARPAAGQVGGEAWTLHPGPRTEAQGSWGRCNEGGGALRSTKWMARGRRPAGGGRLEGPAGTGVGL